YRVTHTDAHRSTPIKSDLRAIEVAPFLGPAPWRPPLRQNRRLTDAKRRTVVFGEGGAHDGKEIWQRAGARRVVCPTSPLNCYSRSLLECKKLLPIVLHADDCPAIFLRLVVKGLREHADLLVSQAPATPAPQTRMLRPAHRSPSRGASTAPRRRTTARDDR